jgi:LDH2 family malate/lactate/ureidoglycolate dehydrogenase
MDEDVRPWLLWERNSRLEMAEMTTITIDDLHERVEAIFRNAGFNTVQAGAVARVIVAAERDACKSHGIYRIEGVLRTAKAGKARIDAVPEILSGTKSAVVKVDARGGFSNAAGEIGLPFLAEKAREVGVAALAVNNAVHFSALWPEVEALTEHGLACLAMCPSYSTVAPAGGNKPLLGTNPVAFGWPRDGQPPYVFDFATSVVARGEIELHRRAGKQLPEGWAIDAEGHPTTDPEKALAGAMLSFGGHKGSAIGTMIELLGGIMIGDQTSREALDFLGTTTLAPTHGELVIAFSLEAFAAGQLGGILARAEVVFDAILSQEARLPSQRRFQAREKSARNGLNLSSAEVEQLNRLLEYGLAAV